MEHTVLQGCSSQLQRQNCTEAANIINLTTRTYEEAEEKGKKSPS